MIRLLIDRITFKYPVDEIYFMACTQILETLHTDGLVTRPRYRTFNNIDCVRAKMTLRRFRGMVVTLHKGYGHCGIKFDWPPRLVDAQTMPRFSRLLESFVPGGFQELAERGSISYLEIAIDVNGAKIEDYLFTYPRIARSFIYFNAQDESQTVYMGTRWGRKSFCMYDKRKQLMACHAHIIRIEKMRIEFRRRQSMRYEELDTFPNPFALLEISSLADARGLDDSEYWQQFLNRCDENGAQSALRHYSHHTRRRFQRLLRQTRPEWADLNQVWQLWPNVIEEFEQNTTVRI